MSEPAAGGSLSSGWGRALVAVYAVFALAATGRSAVQLGMDADRAPLAYSLSLLAAVVYLVATTCLLLGGRTAWRVAVAAVSVEAVGVLVVGTLSLTAPALFPDRTVWSHFGQGYGFLPLLLPAAGLAWLWHTGTRGSQGSQGSRGVSGRAASQRRPTGPA